MTISTDKQITYLDLKNKFLEIAKKNFANLESNYSNIPEEFKPAFTRELSRQNLGGVFVAIEDSSAIQQVSLTEISSELNSFMSSRGINTKENSPITTKGIINFWNNAAIFCATRARMATSPYNGQAFLIYITGEVSYATPGIIDEIGPMNNTDVDAALNSLLSSINSTIKVYPIIYKYTAVCSCSSSSSSSSCSSSVFIAYMNL